MSIVEEVNIEHDNAKSFKEQFTQVSAGIDAVQENVPIQLNAYGPEWEPIQQRIAQLVKLAETARVDTDKQTRTRKLRTLNVQFDKLVTQDIPLFLAAQSQASCTTCVEICVKILQRLAVSYNTLFQNAGVAFEASPSLQRGQCVDRICPRANGFVTCWLSIQQTTIIRGLFWTALVFIIGLFIAYTAFILKPPTQTQRTFTFSS